MNKAILISIRPEHVLDILNGDKTLELRKRVPKGFVGWVYIYVTKGKQKLYYSEGGYADNIGAIGSGYYLFESWMDEEYNEDKLINGKVVARFWLDEYDKYVDATNCYMTSCGMQCDNEYMYQLCELQDELKNTCLTCDEIEAYGKGKDLYAWHIKNLEIFDEPMDLNEFRNIGRATIRGKKLKSVWKPLERGPQSWQYVYVKE